MLVKPRRATRNALEENFILCYAESVLERAPVDFALKLPTDRMVRKNAET